MVMDKLCNCNPGHPRRQLLSCPGVEVTCRQKRHQVLLIWHFVWLQSIPRAAAASAVCWLLAAALMFMRSDTLLSVNMNNANQSTVESYYTTCK